MTLTKLRKRLLYAHRSTTAACRASKNPYRVLRDQRSPVWLTLALAGSARVAEPAAQTRKNPGQCGTDSGSLLTPHRELSE